MSFYPELTWPDDSSPGQVKWHHYAKTLQWRHNYNIWGKAMKLSEYKAVFTYKTYISNFVCLLSMILGQVIFVTSPVNGQNINSVSCISWMKLFHICPVFHRRCILLTTHNHQSHTIVITSGILTQKANRQPNTSGPSSQTRTALTKQTAAVVPVPERVDV